VRSELRWYVQRHTTRGQGSFLALTERSRFAAQRTYSRERTDRSPRASGPTLERKRLAAGRTLRRRPNADGMTGESTDASPERSLYGRASSPVTDSWIPGVGAQWHLSRGV